MSNEKASQLYWINESIVATSKSSFPTRLNAAPISSSAPNRITIPLLYFSISIRPNYCRVLSDSLFSNRSPPLQLQSLGQSSLPPYLLQSLHPLSWPTLITIPISPPFLQSLLLWTLPSSVVISLSFPFPPKLCWPSSSSYSHPLSTLSLSPRFWLTSGALVHVDKCRHC